MNRMGVNLTPIIIKKVVSLRDLQGRSLAIDASIYLHEFIALIRKPDGTPLTNKNGEVTSHLVGLAFRTTRLLTDYHIETVFVFDGTSPLLKRDEINSRRSHRIRAEEEWKRALESGNLSLAFSKAVVTGRLTRAMVDDAKHLLSLLGIPWVQAPGEAEAQAAHMASRGDVWASASKDYDSLLFGAPRLLRFLTITGKEFLPSKGAMRKLQPEIIDLQEFLSYYDLSRSQLLDLAIMIGTDFNKGIRGIGPKTALKLIKAHGSLENMPEGITQKLPSNVQDIRRIFLEPDVISNYAVRWGSLMKRELYEFLCKEQDSENRVKVLVDRMKEFFSRRDLTDWTRGFGK